MLRQTALAIPAAVTEARLIAELRSNPFVLAPMAGITDFIFRSFMRKMGAGVLTSELISAQGLIHQSQKTRDLMRFLEEERPVGIQLFGEDAESLVYAAQVAEQMGADFVDLNLGCPVKKVVKKGAGSALLREPERLGHILGQMKKHISIPLTIKIRTGWDQQSRNAVEIVNLAFNEGVTWVSIHGRTRSQAYTGLADWDYIAGVKNSSPLPIIGNGDLTTPEKALARLQSSACDGVMIGRGCLKNPWIFQEALHLWQTGTPLNPERKYVVLFEDILHRADGARDEKGLSLLLRKLSIWFSSGLPGSSEFRRALFSTKGFAETYRLVMDYYQSVDGLKPADTSDEEFMMGGHG